MDENVSINLNQEESTTLNEIKADIARVLGLNTTAGLKEALESCGAIETRRRIGGKQPRGYLVPPI